MLKALIVDDEAKARRILESLLQEYCPQVQVIGAADSVPAAVKAIQSNKPDVVFLDIEMPNYTGFQLLDFIAQVDFEIIFCTAYNEYALQAFQISAIDYLLKPIQIDLLQKAVEKVEKQRDGSKMQERLEVMQQNMRQSQVSRLALPVAEGLLFVETDEIIYLKAEGAYTNIVLQGGKKVMVSRNIKNFEEMLQQPCFFRPHRSFLINLNHVRQYMRQDGGYILMDNGDLVDLSKERKDEFLQAFQK